MTEDIEHRIVLVSDGHWGQNDDYEANHNNALDKIAEVDAEREVDAVVHLGDMVHDDVDLHDQVITNFFDELPTDNWYTVFGNHDWVDDQEWQDIYGHEKNYTFEIGNFGFVVADSGASRDSNSREPADVDWVENEIDGFVDDGVDGVFVCCHFAHADIGDKSVGENHPEEAKAFREQIKRENVICCFSGHWHEQNGLVSTDEFDGGLWMFVCRMGGADVISTWGQETGNDKQIEELGIRVFDIVNPSQE